MQHGNSRSRLDIVSHWPVDTRKRNKVRLFASAQLNANMLLTSPYLYPWMPKLRPIYVSPGRNFGLPPRACLTFPKLHLAPVVSTRRRLVSRISVPTLAMNASTRAAPQSRRVYTLQKAEGNVFFAQKFPSLRSLTGERSCASCKRPPWDI